MPLLPGPGTVTVDMDSKFVTRPTVGVVEEETEEEEDVTGDGVNDELDCSGIVIGVVVKITVDEDGGEFEELDSVGKENDSEVEVDVVVGVETVTYQYLPC